MMAATSEALNLGARGSRRESTRTEDHFMTGLPISRVVITPAAFRDPPLAA